MDDQYSNFPIRTPLGYIKVNFQDNFRKGLASYLIIFNNF